MPNMAAKEYFRVDPGKDISIQNIALVLPVPNKCYGIGDVWTLLRRPREVFYVVWLHVSYRRS